MRLIGCVLRLLRALGVDVPPQRLATCDVCYTGVFDDDETTRYRGALCHRDCVRYRARR